MKRFQLLSFALVMIFIFNLAVPIAYAAEAGRGTTQLSVPVTAGNYTMSGYKTEEMRLNIVVNNAEQTGRFAWVNST